MLKGRNELYLVFELIVFQLFVVLYNALRTQCSFDPQVHWVDHSRSPALHAWNRSISSSSGGQTARARENKLLNPSHITKSKFFSIPETINLVSLQLWALTSIGTLSYSLFPITVFPWMSMSSRSSIGRVWMCLQSRKRDTDLASTLRAILCQLRSNRLSTSGFLNTVLTASLVSPTALYSTTLFSPSSRIDTWRVNEQVASSKAG